MIGVIGVLLLCNLILTILFLKILYGGPITEEIKRYITNRHLYAPPLVATLIDLSPFLWAVIKWGWGKRKSSQKIEKRFLNAVLETFSRIVPQRAVLGLLIVASLVIVAGTQIWAAESLCSPKSASGSDYVGGIELSDDERTLYLGFADKQTAGILIYESGSGSLNSLDNRYSPRGMILLPAGLDVPRPTGITRTPDGQFLYVADEANGKIHIINLATNKLESIQVDGTPRWIAASHRDGRVYVSNVYAHNSRSRGSVTVIGATRQAVLGEITGVNCPEGLALSPDDQKLYVTSQCGGGHDPLFIVDTATLKVVATIPGLAVGDAVLLSKDGKKAYVSRSNFRWRDSESGEDGAPLTVVNLETNRLIKTFVLQISVGNLALSADGRYLLVVNGYQLSVIDTNTDELIKNFSLRGYGTGIRVRSDNLVIVGVADNRRLVAVPLERILTSSCAISPF